MQRTFHYIITLVLLVATTAAWAQNVNPRTIPLTLEAIYDGTITVTSPKSGMQYSIDGGTKTALTTTNNSIQVDAGQTVRFYGDKAKITSYDGTRIQCSADCYIYGNIMSLVDEMSFASATTLTAADTFNDLFFNNTYLKNHPTNKLLLPATTLTKNCYKYMFHGCSGLTTAPDLPATTLADHCYYAMFYQCSGLTKAPALPATKLEYGCYMRMFYGCRALTTAPDLPATTLKESCYRSMFQGCTSLSYVRCLATNISADKCTLDWLYNVAAQGTFVKAEGMEDWTTGVSGIPEGWTVPEGMQLQPLTLEAIADGTITVYEPKEGMQYSIDGGAKKALTMAISEIPVSAGQKVQLYGKGKSITSYYRTRIDCSQDCYIYGNIMSLVDENDFESNTTLTADNTFVGLFSVNSHLKNHEEKPLVLPATKLTKGCYSNMFKGCSGLFVAPELPATTLTDGCYAYMFQGCYNLRSAPELLAPTLVPYCYQNMFYGCGNLNYVKCMATDISADGCTTDWLLNVSWNGTFVKAAKTEWSRGASGIPTNWTVKSFTPAPALTLEAIADGTITVISPKSGMQYSIDDGTKNLATTPTTEIPVSAGQKVQFYGNGTSITSYYGTRIDCSQDCYIYGNIMSLVDENDFEYNTTLKADNTFRGFFYGNTHLKNHPDKPLVLPATELTENCYAYMFEGCKGLTVAPELSATTLVKSCYYQMFLNCTGLTEVPDLPATELAEGCYLDMFSGCTNLTKAPELLAPTLQKNSYKNMFFGCSNLNYVRCLATDISADGCTENWLKNVASRGTFFKAENTNWTTGASGIPEGWTAVGPNGITLYDTGDNRATVDAKDGQTLDYVLLDGRTLYRDGTWNSLCLPFDVSDGDTSDGITFTGTPLEGATVALFVSASFSGGTLTLKFINITDIEAGMPYLVKWTTTGGNLQNPLFTNVKIDNNVSVNNIVSVISFQGTYATITYEEDDHTILYLGADDKLYYPLAGATIGAQRAYFKLADGLTAGDPDSSVQSIALNFGEEIPGATEIPSTTNLTNYTNSDAWYTLDGRKLDKRPTVKGVYVNNGLKVVIK